MSFEDIITEIESIFIQPNKNNIINLDIGSEFINNYIYYEEMCKYWNKKLIQINSTFFTMNF